MIPLTLALGLSLVGAILFRWACLRRGRLGPFRVEYRWAIGVYAGPSPFNLRPAAGARNPVLQPGDVTDAKARLIADPFLIHEGGRWHLFFEVVEAATNRGAVGLAQSADGLLWRYRRIVLREPFHLSYPHVFDWNGAFYLIPETESQRAVRLYRAEEFPFRWAFVTTLLAGRPFHDPTPLRHAGRWWLFVGEGADNDTLRLFGAGDLPGPWREHPRSPLVRGDPHGARPGGRILSFEGRIIRFAQECSPYYGKGLRAFEVSRLTPEEYAEREIPLPLADAPRGLFAWNRYGMHHLDVQRAADGRWLACADGQRRVITLAR